MPMRTRNARLGFILLVCVFLNACSTRIDLPERSALGGPVPDDWSQREAVLLALDQWHLVGKIAVRQDGQSESAVINHWTQDNSAYQLQLSSAFMGLGTVRLEGDTDYLMIQTSNGDRYVSDDPETLVLNVTGWQLPLDVLPYWVRGVPAPTAEAELGFAPEGELKMLVQSGWEVHFQRYSLPAGGDIALPTLITASNGDARVRLAINDWQLGPQD